VVPASQGSSSTHFADEFAEKEVDQLAEKENRKGKNEPPHGSELVKPGNDNVCRNSKVQEERTRKSRASVRD
jgi:hypothetical protein